MKEDISMVEISHVALDFIVCDLKLLGNKLLGSEVVFLQQKEEIVTGTRNIELLVVD